MQEEKTEKETIVISLGGSLIVPNEIDVNFLSSFILLIKENVSKGSRFVIITGGGRTCRHYNESLQKVIDASNEDLDWMGIAATRLNAEFVRICFGDLSYEKVVLDPDFIPVTNKPIIIGGGWKPGNSSDLAAIHCAKTLNTKKIINLSNIDYVHSSDPKTNPNAEKFENLTWEKYRSFISSVWKPGLNTPFDPIASEMAEKEEMEVVFISGQNLESLKSYLNGKPFIGTTIK
jgi:uridylate kinase